MIERFKRIGARAQDLAYALPAPPALRTLAEYVIRVVNNYGRHDGPHAAAGIAYYALFSLFPLILGTLAIAGLFMGTEQAQARLIEFLDQQVPGIGDSDLLRENIRGVVEARGLMGAISVFTLMWAGRAVFIAVRRISNRAWEVKEKPHFLMVQVTNFLATLAISGLFFFSLFGATVGRVLARQPFIERLGLDIPLGLLVNLLPFLLSLMVFLVVYRFVPDVKVRWREAAMGAIPAAALFEALKFGFSIYLDQFANYEQVYGNLSTVIVVMFGLFLTAQIFVIGAELSSEYARSRRAGLLDLREQLTPVPGGLAPRSRWKPPQDALAEQVDGVVSSQR